MNLMLRKYLVGAVLTWVCSAALAAVVYAIVISPQNRLRNQLTRQIAQKQELYEDAVTATLSVARAQLEDELQRLSERFNRFAIDVADLADLTFDISRIASEQKLSSFTITDKGDWKNSSIGGCDNVLINHIDVSFTGSFTQFAVFLNEMERHKPVVFVDKFSITRQPDGSAGHAVSLNLAVLVTEPKNV